MRVVITISLLTLCVNLFAQQSDAPVKKDTLQHGYVERLRGEIQKGKQKLSINSILSTDTTNQAAKQKVDSLKTSTRSVTDSLQSPQSVSVLNEKKDSLHQLVTAPVDKLEKTKNKITSALSNKTDSVTSLTGGLQMPGKVLGKTDSLQSKVNALNERVSGAQNKVQDKVDSLQSKLSSAVTETTKKIEGKINGVTGDRLDIPGAKELNVAGVELPNVKAGELSLSQTNMPSLDGNLPALKTDNLNTGLNTNLPNIGDVKVTDVKLDAGSVELPKDVNLDQVNKVTEQVGSVDDKLAELEPYERDLQKIKDREQLQKLPQEAESQLENVEEVNALEGEFAKAKKFQTEQQNMLHRYKDKKLLQEEITRKASNVANEYLEKNTPAVTQAQAQLAKAKKAGGLKSLKDIFKKSDELENKKFYQRLVPGITLQSFGNNVFTLDLGAQLGYRLSPRLTAGAGVTYRTGFDKQFKYFATGLGVHGFRTYADFVALKGIYVHAEYERLQVNPMRFSKPTTNDEGPYSVSSSYFGVGKKLNLSRNIKVCMLALYRVEYNGHLPSMQKLNMRVGFDYVFKKKRSIVVK